MLPIVARLEEECTHVVDYVNKSNDSKRPRAGNTRIPLTLDMADFRRAAWQHDDEVAIVEKHTRGENQRARKLDPMQREEETRERERRTEGEQKGGMSSTVPALNEKIMPDRRTEKPKTEK